MTEDLSNWAACGQEEESETGVGVRAHRVDRAVSGQVILVGGIVAMPGNHVKGGVVLLRLEHLPAQLVQHCEAAFPVLEMCNRRLEIPRGCQTICT